MVEDIKQELKKYNIMTKLNKYISDSYENFFDKNLSPIKEQFVVDKNVVKNNILKIFIEI